MHLSTHPLKRGRILATGLLVLGCGGTERNSDLRGAGSTATASGGTGDISSSTAASMGATGSVAAGPAGGAGGTGALGANNTTGGTAGALATEATGGTATSASTDGMETTGGNGLEQVDCDLSPCAQDELCIPWEQGCDANIGRCVERESCSDASNGRICGCDGNIYESRCDALLAGARQADPSACATPEGAFVCDRIYCEVGVQVCKRQTITECNGSTSTGAVCANVPDPCLADPTCDCLNQITHETYDQVLGTCSYFGGWGLLSSHTCQTTDGALEEACVYSNGYCFG